MSEVSSNLRALRLIAAFASLRRPLRLSEIAAEIEVPVSSCYALVRRLVNEGYLFQIASTKLYYPSGKLQQSTEVIAAHNPLRDVAEDLVQTLRDQTNETVTFGQRLKTEVVYLYGAESTLAVRMAARIGLVRPLHATAMGKALASVISADERTQLLARYKFEQFTPQTLTSARDLDEDIQRGLARGYFLSNQESVAGAMAIAVPITINYSVYGLQIAGPVERMRSKIDGLAEALGGIRDRIAVPHPAS